MALSKDWREFLELLNSSGVDYVIVGAQGLPRASTHDRLGTVWMLQTDALSAILFAVAGPLCPAQDQCRAGSGSRGGQQLRRVELHEGRDS